MRRARGISPAELCVSSAFGIALVPSRVVAHPKGLGQKSMEMHQGFYKVSVESMSLRGVKQAAPTVSVQPISVAGHEMRMRKRQSHIGHTLARSVLLSTSIPFSEGS